MRRPLRASRRPVDARLALADHADLCTLARHERQEDRHARAERVADVDRLAGPRPDRSEVTPVCADTSRVRSRGRRSPAERATDRSGRQLLHERRQVREDLAERRREMVDLRCHRTRPGTASHAPELDCGRSTDRTVAVERRNEVPADLFPQVVQVISTGPLPVDRPSQEQEHRRLAPVQLDLEEQCRQDVGEYCPMGFPALPGNPPSARCGGNRTRSRRAVPAPRGRPPSQPSSPSHHLGDIRTFRTPWCSSQHEPTRPILCGTV
jgi:hypothetical protein